MPRNKRAARARRRAVNEAQRAVRGSQMRKMHVYALCSSSVGNGRHGVVYALRAASMRGGGMVARYSCA